PSAGDRRPPGGQRPGRQRGAVAVHPPDAGARRPLRALSRAPGGTPHRPAAPDRSFTVQRRPGPGRCAGEHDRLAGPATAAPVLNCLHTVGPNSFGRSTVAGQVRPYRRLARDGARSACSELGDGHLRGFHEGDHLAADIQLQLAYRAGGDHRSDDAGGGLHVDLRQHVAEDDFLDGALELVAYVDGFDGHWYFSWGSKLAASLKLQATSSSALLLLEACGLQLAAAF